MGKKSRGFLHRTTRSLRKRKRSKLTINKLLKEFKMGDKVLIKVERGFPNIPHRRYWGKIGEIIDKQGEYYKVKIKSKENEKYLLVHPVHLQLVKN